MFALLLVFVQLVGRFAVVYLVMGITAAFIAFGAITLWVHPFASIAFILGAVGMLVAFRWLHLLREDIHAALAASVDNLKCQFNAFVMPHNFGGL